LKILKRRKGAITGPGGTGGKNRQIENGGGQKKQSTGHCQDGGEPKGKRKGKVNCGRFLNPKRREGWVNKKKKRRAVSGLNEGREFVYLCVSRKKKEKRGRRIGGR